MPRRRYLQQGLPGSGREPEAYGPKQPGPVLEHIQQGELLPPELGPLFEGHEESRTGRSGGG